MGNSNQTILKTFIPFSLNHNMFKDEKGNIIGRGEIPAREILHELFPNIEIKYQVKLSSLLPADWADDLSERQQKETIDIVVYSNPIIAIRVQDPHHAGKITAARDLVQKKTLEWNNVKVVDLEFYECVNLMKDVVNDESRQELILALKSENIHL